MRTNSKHETTLTSVELQPKHIKEANDLLLNHFDFADPGLKDYKKAMIRLLIGWISFSDPLLDDDERAMIACKWEETYYFLEKVADFDDKICSEIELEAANRKTSKS